VIPAEEVTVVSNTGDDLEMFGLHISPDVDIVIYALAGVVNPETGWGIQGDTLAVVQALRRFGYPDWFNLGDRDMAMAIHRTRLLREGTPMHVVVADLARAWGLRCRILPMTDAAVRTVIHGPEGPLPFQDYMVKLRTDVEVRRVEFAGAEAAAAAPGVADAILGSETIVLAPSNPLVSIGPILAIREIREALAAAPGVRVAVSPIIAGQVVKGPAAKMLASLGHEVSALGVARIYAAGERLIDAMVIDEQDRALAPAIEGELGIHCIVTDTLMVSDEKKQALARAALSARRSP
jgi:LPPG:FO 2-phospho-L-lactate transferase